MQPLLLSTLRLQSEPIRLFPELRQRQPEGTYGFPYIKLGTDFTVAGSFTNTPAGGVATTYYSRGAGNASYYVGQQLRKQTH